MLRALLVTFVATGFLFARSLRLEEADHPTRNDAIATAGGGRAPADSPSAIGPKAILVVDDEPDIAAIVAEKLRGAGHHVEVTANGRMALATI